MRRALAVAVVAIAVVVVAATVAEVYWLIGQLVEP